MIRPPPSLPRLTMAAPAAFGRLLEEAKRGVVCPPDPLLFYAFPESRWDRKRLRAAFGGDGEPWIGSLDAIRRLTPLGWEWNVDELPGRAHRFIACLIQRDLRSSRLLRTFEGYAQDEPRARLIALLGAHRHIATEGQSPWINRETA